MNITLTPADLIAFEENIKQAFLNQEIRAPIHLNDPNQIPHLMKIFQEIQPQDWLCLTYRGHYHALLKGVPPAKLLADILQGRSMYYCDRERRIISSAIVGGLLPVAVGLGMGIQHEGGKERVWCFVGDMAAETGAFHEATKYAGRHGLPVTFVVEDNGLSTNTPTQAVWGPEGNKYRSLYTQSPRGVAELYGADVRYYRYTRNVPHVGAGQWVTFS